jgi:hypothetical protein
MSAFITQSASAEDIAAYIMSNSSPDELQQSMGAALETVAAVVGPEHAAVALRMFNSMPVQDRVLEIARGMKYFCEDKADFEAKLAAMGLGHRAEEANAAIEEAVYKISTPRAAKQ